MKREAAGSDEHISRGLEVIGVLVARWLELTPDRRETVLLFTEALAREQRERKLERQKLRAARA